VLRLGAAHLVIVDKDVARATTLAARLNEHSEAPGATMTPNASRARTW
jgi:hypothetical protein